ncbi:MAG TPA: acyl carrier protein [Nannocystaceae bacterium]|nr:acyl carrier protein [Nannocystaceae bacterium]
MTNDEIYRHIVDILVKLFELDGAEITPHSKLFEELDLDSIDAVDMFVEIHALTGRRIEADVARKVRTVQDVVDLVASELAKASPAAAS